MVQMESTHPEIENHLVQSGDYQTVVNLDFIFSWLLQVQVDLQTRYCDCTCIV